MFSLPATRSRNAHAAIACTLLLFCAAYAHAGDAERFPRFEGTVLPITKPFFAEYHSYDSIDRVVMEVEVRTNGELDYRLKTTSATERQVRRAGEALTQSLRLKEMKISGTRIPRKEREAMSKLTFVLSGDVRGQVTGVSVRGLRELQKLFPQEVIPQEGTPEYDAFIAEMRSGAQSAPALTAEAVQTGAVLTSVKLWDQFGDEAMPPELQQMFGNDEIRTTAKGWGFYDNRKVLVAEQSFETSAMVPGDTGPAEHSISIVMHGYSLFDATSFAPVKSDTLMLLLMESSKDGERGVIRFRGTSEAQVTNRPDVSATVAIKPFATPTITGLSVQSKQDKDGRSKTFVFFDMQWRVAAPAGAGLQGKLILLDNEGRERAAMPWPISASDAAKGSFTETGVGFELGDFGEAGQWLRLADVSEIKARFDVAAPK